MKSKQSFKLFAIHQTVYKQFAAISGRKSNSLLSGKQSSNSLSHRNTEANCLIPNQTVCLDGKLFDPTPNCLPSNPPCANCLLLPQTVCVTPTQTVCTDLQTVCPYTPTTNCLVPQQTVCCLPAAPTSNSKLFGPTANCLRRAISKLFEAISKLFEAIQSTHPPQSEPEVSRGEPEASRARYTSHFFFIHTLQLGLRL